MFGFLWEIVEFFLVLVGLAGLAAGALFVASAYLPKALLFDRLIGVLTGLRDRLRFKLPRK
jgi:hypothetical protein